MANALESASLVMIPSGYEDGTLGSLKPTDGSGDFTFSRGSDISATRVKADGYIEKGYENLLLQSNSFDTTWLNSNTTETSGQAGYDGTNDAWLLSKSAANGMVYQSISSSGVQTISIYAKKGTNSWMQIYAVGSSNVRAYYDLENGVLGAYSLNTIDRKIEDIGLGWYRCSVTFNSSLSAVRVFVSDGSNNDSGTSGSIYIQDAQLNQGLVAYPYIETTTAPVAGGILEDMPRLDYSNGSCPALLLEPQRTNALPQSEYLSSSAYYSFNRISVNDNSIVSPENKMNASKLIVSSGTGYTRLFRATGGLGSQVVSIFAKAGEMNAISVSSYTGSAYLYAMYNLTNGTLINSNADDTGIEDMGDGWYRIWVYVANSSTRYAHISVGQSTDSPSPLINTTGNGVDGIYAYGFQAEQDATYPTSYIPTYGVSQTRLKEKIENTSLNSFIDTSNPYTIFFDFTRANKTYSAAYQIIGIDNGTYTSRLKLQTRASITEKDFFINIYDGTTQSNSSYIDNAGQHKIAIVYNGATSYKIFKNGVEFQTLTCGAINGTRFVSGENGNQHTIENHNQMILFPTALSDDECIALTTI